MFNYSQQRSTFLQHFQLFNPFKLFQTAIHHIPSSIYNYPCIFVVMEIDDALFDKLAHLSKLQFDEEEKKSIKKDLQNMIGLIEKMNEADTEGVEPLLHILPHVNRLRADEVHGQVTTSEALKNAPDNDGNFFRVPKVINKPIQ